MAKDRYPITPAIRCLRQHQADFEPLLYDYQERGGTAHSSAQLGWDEHAVIKTLVLRRDDASALLMLMHGDCEVSLRGLGRIIGAKSVETCTPELANRLTGYQVGGISPFGTKTALPVYAQSTIFALNRIAINGGKRGFLVGLDPRVLEEILKPTRVDVAVGSVP